MLTSILNSIQIDFDKEIDYYNDNDNDDNNNKDHNNIYNKSNNWKPLSKSYIIEGECYLTVKKFNYTMNALDRKVNAIYKLY
jgi:hypothetical protein